MPTSPGCMPSACLDALRRSANYDMHIAYVSPGRILAISDRTQYSAPSTQAPALTLAEAVDHIRTLDVDAMIPQMFCIPGMTTYRALFDELGIPYLGNPAEVMAVGVDKHQTRCDRRRRRRPVPAAEVLGPGERPTLPFPVVVKPIDADNSVAVSLARNPAEFDAAAALALAHGRAALVETYIELGREVRCGIMVRDGELVCLPLEEYAMDSEQQTDPNR